MVKCSECGFENPKGSKYCSECGNEIKTDSDKPVKKNEQLLYLVTFFIPLIGILGGLYYWGKGYKNVPILRTVHGSYKLNNYLLALPLIILNLIWVYCLSI